MSSEYLPEDLLIPILRMLPPKSLVRFRCVCKSWSALFSNEFIFKGLLDYESKKNFHIFVKTRWVFTHLLYSLSYDTLDLSTATVQVLPKTEEAEEDEFAEMDIVGCCNGIFCLTDAFLSSFHLWNPTTNESKVIPLTQRYYMYHYPYQTGFGYDAETDDYKVVVIPDLPWGWFEIYSLNNDSWKRVDINPHIEASLSRSPCTRAYVNGMILWWARQDSDHVRDLIVSLDMTSELFTTISGPEFVTLPGYTRVFDQTGIFPLKDSVALFVAFCKEDDYSGNYFDICVLLKYGVEESWTRVLTTGTLFGISRPWGIWKNGVLFFSGCVILLYDPATQEFTELPIDGSWEDLFHVGTYEKTYVPIKGGKNHDDEDNK